MTKELGDYPADFENYFLRWDSVFFYPNPQAKASELKLYGHKGETGSLPCHEHKTCKAKVVAKTKYPPRVCPHCGIDTEKEFQALPQEKRDALWPLCL